jgi:hypothetical protein
MAHASGRLDYEKILSMTDSNRTWHLHVGAHKTASTHLQEQLEALRPELAAAGVGMATLDQLRPVRALDLRLRRPKVWLGGVRLRHEIEDRVAQQTPLLPRMIVSEEDILGNAADPLAPRMYPRAGFRVRALASALLAPDRGGIWLSVRSLDRFLPAAYATALKHGALPFDSEALKTRVLASPPDWSTLVARLLRAAPGVPLTVWNYADYRANTRAIITDLTGVAPAQMPIIADPVATQTPDATAIRTAEALPQQPDPHIRAARIAEIYATATGPRFGLFTDEEITRLQALHRIQLQAIRAMPQVRVLQF